MATNYFGTYISASTTIHTGPGVLLGLLISNSQNATMDTVTIYDNTAASGTVLMKLFIPPADNARPLHVRFPRTQPIEFSTGLHVDAAKSEVNVWAVGR